ncbi:hypothetical protein LU11_gp366 [Pseudomonas phage Lu11]|uniref:hypothetical protein n=1 Tax=Pseudomonas phage Lu11 TaxID=1161927 RepID=UPI00025F18CB|nr:hypothetical protein LU11_gp366 [Pseudomonas phage Lu11]AFH14897.1 hypothetical protein Lu11_0359 [Pseudomonas phage Lu11]
MNKLRNHLSSFSGMAVQAQRDAVTESFDAITGFSWEPNDLAVVLHNNVKRMTKAAKSFRKQRPKIECCM